jgi:hypothetical protein
MSSESKLTSNETILLHAISMKKEASKEEMLVLKKVNEVKYMDYLANRYSDLHLNYPAIFKLIAYDSDKFDINRLKTMLIERDRIEKKEITLENASEKIGKQYFNEFCASKVKWDKEKTGTNS